MGTVTCYRCSWGARHAGNQGMGWLAEIKGRFRRLLVYFSRKSTSGVFCSLSFSQHHLPKFSGFESLFPSIHFPQHDPCSFQQLRDTVLILAFSIHLQRNLSMLWIKKTKESYYEPLQTSIWMRDKGKRNPSTFPTSLQYRWISHCWHLSPWKVLPRWVTYCSEQKAHIYLQI